MAIRRLTLFVYRRRYKLIVPMFIIMLAGLRFAYFHLLASSNGSLNSEFRQHYNDAREFTPRRTVEVKQVNESHEAYSSKIRGVRHSVCDGCFDIKFTSLMSSRKLCNKELIKLVIFITTVFQDKNARDAIRQSWASVIEEITPQSRYFFIIGNSLENDWFENLQNEIELYNDIVMYDFIDVYQNLTIKTVLGFKHALEYCPSAQYVMKTDTDVFVNVPEILKLISDSDNKTFQIGNSEKVYSTMSNLLNEDNNRKEKEMHMFGIKWHNTKPIRSTTGKRGKWYVSENEYVGQFYPDYLDGHGYILSRKAAIDVVAISRDVSFFKFEDVYIGLCLKQLGYNITHTEGFIRSNYPLTLCSYKHKYIFTVHGVSHDMMTSIWLKNCSKSDIIEFEHNSKSNRWIKLPQKK